MSGVYRARNAFIYCNSYDHTASSQRSEINTSVLIIGLDVGLAPSDYHNVRKKSKKQSLYYNFGTQGR